MASLLTRRLNTRTRRERVAFRGKKASSSSEFSALLLYISPNSISHSLVDLAILRPTRGFLSLCWEAIKEQPSQTEIESHTKRYKGVAEKQQKKNLVKPVIVNKVPHYSLHSVPNSH